MVDFQPKDGFVFVVTYGRSGSTLLQTVLQSIDGYFIRGENTGKFPPMVPGLGRMSLNRNVMPAN